MKFNLIFFFRFVLFLFVFKLYKQQTSSYNKEIIIIKSIKIHGKMDCLI